VLKREFLDRPMDEGKNKGSFDFGYRLTSLGMTVK
jgi:hypothetical protein